MFNTIVVNELLLCCLVFNSSSLGARGERDLETGASPGTETLPREVGRASLRTMVISYFPSFLFPSTCDDQLCCSD